MSMTLRPRKAKEKEKAPPKPRALLEKKPASKPLQPVPQKDNSMEKNVLATKVTLEALNEASDQNKAILAKLPQSQLRAPPGPLFRPPFSSISSSIEFIIISPHSHFRSSAVLCLGPTPVQPCSISDVFPLPLVGDANTAPRNSLFLFSILL